MRPGNPLAPSLGAFRYGAGDPTTRIDGTTFWRATLTPDGPGTIRIESAAEPAVTVWGPGGDWLARHAPGLTGALDPGHRFEDAHPVVMAAQRNHGAMRIGASRTLYHELLPVVLGQRITAGEALRQWYRLTQELGEPAPGPAPGLLLPPAPDALLGKPAWWYHQLGIEAGRAETLRAVARHPQKLFRWAELPVDEAGRMLQLISGVGQWTIGCVLGTALGDPDAVAVGDFHLKNIIVHAFTGRARGTDEEMMQLLAPYAGQRGRVVKWLMADGHTAPTFGPRQRVLPMSRW